MIFLREDVYHFWTLKECGALRIVMRSLFVVLVIASEAKQSIARHNEQMDCFVASAPRNDAEVYDE